MGTETPSSTPHNHYPTRDGKWVAIACTNDKMFERLANVMAQPELARDDQYGLKPKKAAGTRAHQSDCVGLDLEVRSRRSDPALL
jgi:crotonobetainyl-CoA:carnitine CoA-transferase CaiB-like acyl-CoA transferase